MTVLAIVAGDQERDEVRRIGAALGEQVEFIGSDSLALSRAIASDLLFVGDGIQQDRTLSLIRRLHRRNLNLLIAAMPGNPEPGIVDLLEAGATVVIREGQSPDEAAEAIRAAQEGRALLDPETTGALVVRIQELSKLCVDERIDVSRCKALTAREREIVGLMARRATNEQIAARLGIAVGTVKTHVHNILDKLDVESRSLAGVYWRLFSGESRAARI